MTALAAEAPAVRARASWSEAVLAALLATLEQPSGWAVALAGFLARGGLLAFLLPIVVLPTPAGIQAQLSPLLRPLVFGEPAPGLMLLGAGLVVLVLACLVVGGLIGAWADVVLIRRAAAALSAAPAAPGGPRRQIGAVLVVRLIAHLPLAVALAWGAVRIFEATYRELVTPFEVVTPLLPRIVLAVPDALAAIGLAWLLGEAAGGLAARELVLGNRALLPSVRDGWLHLVRRPLASLATLVLTTGVVAIAILPALVASATAWSRLRLVLFTNGGPAEIALALGLFVALWLGGLVLAGVATAARSCVWTAEWLRRRPVSGPEPTRHDDGDRGTIGGRGGTDRGDWSGPVRSGTL